MQHGQHGYGLLQGDAVAAKPREVHSGTRVGVRPQLRSKRNDVTIERYTRHAADADNSAVASGFDAAAVFSAFILPS